MRKLFFLLTLLLLGVSAFPKASFGLMSTGTYTIFADSIDAGGVLSASGTYNLEDTVGESPAGSAASSTYEIIAGYQAMDWSVLTAGTLPSSLALGSLATDRVTTSSITFLVTTNADDGYVLSVGSVTGNGLASVADGEVTFGQEEYGVAVSGVDSAFADDRAITAGLNLAASSTPVSDIVTIVTFKAAISPASVPGVRSQTVTLSLSTSI